MDWEYANDYSEGMWIKLQQHYRDGLVLVTGESDTVRDFVEAAFNEIGIEIELAVSGLI